MTEQPTPGPHWAAPILMHWSDRGAVVHPLHPRRSNVTTNVRGAVTCPDCLTHLETR